MDLIDHTFMNWEAEEIKRIHVSELGQDDSLVWPFTSDGEYSVRSAYHMLVSESVMAEQASTSSGEQKVWKGIWHILPLIKFVILYGGLSRTLYQPRRICTKDIFHWI